MIRGRRHLFTLGASSARSTQSCSLGANCLNFCNAHLDLLLLVLQLRRRRLVRSLLRHLSHRHHPRLAPLILLLLNLKRIHPHLRVRPRTVRVEALDDVAQDIAVRNDDDVALGAGAEPAPDPARALLEGGDGAGVEPGFGEPVGGEEGEVEAGVFGVGFEVCLGLEETCVVSSANGCEGRRGWTHGAGIAWELVRLVRVKHRIGHCTRLNIEATHLLQLGQNEHLLPCRLEPRAEVAVADHHRRERAAQRTGYEQLCSFL